MVLGGVAAFAGPLLGQIPDNPGPPPAPSGSQAVAPYIWGLLLVAIVCGVSLKSSKRTHQD